jgi:hypothetical protein
MNVRSVAISASVLLLTLWSAASATSISWKPGSTAPRQWVIDPANPTPLDTIRFSGPTLVYSNSCEAERALSGTPQLLVDSKAKVITLWFKGPVPQVCSMVFSPVAGLEGEFGPLPTGDWVFTCLSRDAAFEISFTVRDKLAHHVDADARGSVHNGRTWETAMLTLQDALAVASGGDEILVAEGVYRPDQGGLASRGDRTASFDLPKGVALKGGYAGDGTINPDMRDPNRYPTILSGDLLGDDLQGTLNRDDNSYHVVAARGLFPPPRLDGFTIQSGQADGAYPNESGGGLYVTAGSPEVVNCTFKSNTAVFGGAIATVQAAPVLSNCTLTGNRALLFGGALYNEDGAVTLTNDLIVGNSAGEAAALGSSVLCNLGGSITLNDCTVADNMAPKGMAIASLVWGSPAMGQITATNSILYNGGDEIFSTDPCAVVVAYSDVQGNWSGIGNLNADPHFVNPGRWSIGGDWIDGDYRLRSDSSCIDEGDKTRLPADTLDIDGDGNISEALPVDLNGNPRLLDLQVDMGAYENSGSGSGTGYAWVPLMTLTSTFDVPYGLTGPITVNSDLITVTPSSSFRAELKLEVTATSTAGGTWTAWFDPSITTVGPGNFSVSFRIRGEKVAAQLLTPGATNVPVATVTIYVRPAL